MVTICLGKACTSTWVRFVLFTILPLRFIHQNSIIPVRLSVFCLIESTISLIIKVCHYLFFFVITVNIIGKHKYRISSKLFLHPSLNSHSHNQRVKQINTVSLEYFHLFFFVLACKQCLKINRIKYLKVTGIVINTCLCDVSLEKTVEYNKWHCKHRQEMIRCHLMRLKIQMN